MRKSNQWIDKGVIQHLDKLCNHFKHSKDNLLKSALISIHNLYESTSTFSSHKYEKIAMTYKTWICL